MVSGVTSVGGSVGGSGGGLSEPVIPPDAGGSAVCCETGPFIYKAARVRHHFLGP